MKFFVRAIRALSMTGLLVALSCQNMLTGNDVNDKVKGQVSEANAASAGVTIQVDQEDVGGNIVSPPSSVKIGIPFSIEVQVDNDHAFKNWTWSGDGALTIDNVTATKTNATLTKAASKTPVVIQANFYNRPVVTISPAALSTNTRNTPIRLLFTNAMDASTVTLANVAVEEVSTQATVDVTNTYFSGIAASDGTGKNFALTFKNGAKLQGNFQYQVTVSKRVKDANGNVPASNATSSFFTNLIVDQTAPSISVGGSGISSTNGVSTATSVDTKSNTVYLSVTAVNNGGQDVRTLEIDEKVGTTDLGTTQLNYSGAIVPYTLKSGDQAVHSLTITATNAINIASSGFTVTANYDTTAPALAFGTAGTNTGLRSSTGFPWVTSNATVFFDFTATDTNITAGDTTKTVVSFNGTPVTVTYASGTYTASGQLAGNDLAVAVTVTDPAGNTKSLSETLSAMSSPPFQVDAVNPVLSLVSLASQNNTNPGTPNTAWAKTGDNLVLTFTASDLHLPSPPDSSTGWTASINGVNAPITLVTANTAPNTNTYKAVVALGSVNTITSYTVTVADQAGNTATSSTGLTPSFQIDNAIPTVGTVTATDTTINSTAWAKNTDTVKLVFSVNDFANLAVGSPAVALTGSSTAPTMSDNGSGTYTATFTGAAGLSNGSNGVLQYTITTATKAGTPGGSSTPTDSSLTVDNATPGVTSIAIASDNSGSTNPTWAKKDDTITVTIATTDGTGPVANTAAPGVAMTINGTAVTGTVNVGGAGSGSYTATYVVLAGDANGAVGVTVTPKNQAKASGTGSSTITGAGVTVDNATPGVTSIAIASDNSGSTNPTWAKKDDTITVTIATTDGAGPVANTAAPGVAMTINGTAVTGTVNVGGAGSGSYTATYVVLAGDANGAVGVTVTPKNQAKASGTGSSTITGAGVTVDKLIPTVGTVTATDTTISSTAWAKNTDTITLVFTVADSANLAANPAVALTGSSTTATVNGVSGTYTATFTGAAGLSNGSNGVLQYTITTATKAGTPGGSSTPTDSSLTVDNATPGVTSIAIASDNSGSTNPTWAKKDDTITVTIATTDGAGPVANTAAPGVAMTINGTAVTGTVNVGGAGSGSYTATYVVLAGDANGAVGVTVTPKNQAKASGTGSSTITGAGVTVDNATPGVTSIAIASDNSGSTNPTWAKKDDTITVTIATTDGAGPVANTAAPGVAMTINGTAVTGTVNVGGAGSGSYTATYVVLAGDANGAVGVTVTPKNQAKASGTGSSTITGAGVTVDKLIPTVGTVTATDTTISSTAWAKNTDTIILVFTVADSANLAANPAVALTGSSTTATVNGVSGTYTATFTGAAGLSNGSNGVLQYTITTATKAGTPGGSSTPTDSSLTVDNATPGVTSIAIASDNSGSTNPTWAKKDDTITVTIATTDGTGPVANTAAPGVAMTINGTAVTGTVNVGGAGSGSYTATYVVLAGDANGAVGVTVTPKNQAKASGTGSSTITGAGVTVDNATPGVTSIAIASDNSGSTNPTWAKKDDTITVTIATTDGAGPVANTAAPGVAMTINGTAVTGTVNVGGAGSGSYTATYVVLAGDANGAVGVTVTPKNQAKASGTGSSTITGAGVTVDKLIPTVGTVTATDTTISSTAWAKNTDTIILVFTVADSANLAANPAVALTGSSTTATVNGVSGTYTATFTGAAGLSNGSNGVLQYTITTATKAGTPGGSSTPTDSSLTVDNATPGVTSIAIASDNSGSTNPTWAKKDDTITVTIATTDGAGPVANTAAPGVAMTINGTAVTGTVNVGGAGSGSYTATYVVLAGDANGAVGVTVTPKNQAKASGTGSSTITGAGVTVDKLIPTVGTVTATDTTISSTAWAKNTDTITLVFTVADSANLAANPAVALTGSSTTATVNGVSGTYTATFTGAAGLSNGSNGVLQYTITTATKAGTPGGSSTPTDSSLTVDNATPGVTSIAIASDNSGSTNPTWAKKDDTITVTIATTDGAGPVANTAAPGVAMTINGTAVTGTVNVGGAGSGSYTATYVVLAGDANGAVGVTVTPKNQAKASGTGSSTITGAGVTVDKVIPTINVSSVLYNTVEKISALSSIPATLINNDTLDVVFTISESTTPATLATSVIKFDAGAASATTFSPSSGTYTAHYKATSSSKSSGFVIGASGSIADPAGNPAPQVTYVGGAGALSSIAGTDHNSRLTASNTSSPYSALFAGSPQRSWFDESPLSDASNGTVPASNAMQTVAPVSALAIPASFTLDRLPVLADVSSFARTPVASPRAEVPVAKTSVAVKVPAKKVAPATAAAAPIPVTIPVAPRAPAPLPGTNRSVPTIDIYVEERRARDEETGPTFDRE